MFSILRKQKKNKKKSKERRIHVHVEIRRVTIYCTYVWGFFYTENQKLNKKQKTKQIKHFLCGFMLL